MDLFLDLVNAVNKHGLSWATAIAVVVALLKNRKAILKLLHRGKEQETQLDIIEHKIDFLLEKEGIKWGVHYSNGKTLHKETDGLKSSLLQRLAAYVRVHIIGASTRMSMVSYHSKIRGESTLMKRYLSKLGSRKFQAFLAVTIPNMIILIGFLLGDIDLEGKVNEWMPAINLLIQSITTGIYQWAESRVDVATAVKIGDSGPAE